jgi:transglutaminase-like putative cysteine protease
MDLIIMDSQLTAYLEETSVINYSHPAIQKQVQLFKQTGKTKLEQIDLAFQFARDRIQHSFDSKEVCPVTITASDTLEKKEGICFAKAHLLAAFLRALNIPTGFCYQKVTRKGTVESGYALHGLNAVYIEEVDKWVRLDPRGNKPGVYSEFRMEEEILAYTLHSELGEIDYPYIFAKPLNSVVYAMEISNDSIELFNNRPENIEV